jgi:hypothetical protein
MITHAQMAQVAGAVQTINALPQKSLITVIGAQRVGR